MTILTKFAAKRPKIWVLALPVAAIALTGFLTPAVAGSDNPMFQRHFWRGQNNHGAIDFDGRRSTTATGLASAEALVEPGTRGAAVAADASYCASRFWSYDPATGTYRGRDGRLHACP